MTEYKLYPSIPSALPEAFGPRFVDAPPQVGYHLIMVQAKRRGLVAKEKIFNPIQAGGHRNSSFSRI